MALALVGMSGCLDSTAPETIQWSAELEPVGEAVPGVTGQMAAISRYRTTDVGISIQNAVSDSIYTWSVHSGECGGETDPLASAAFYAELVPGTAGSAESETGIPVRLEDGMDYVGLVFNSDSDLVSCGKLDRSSL